MHYLVLSFNHRNCDIVTRERLSLKDEKVVGEFVASAMNEVSEIIVLSTCNRIELISATKNLHSATMRLLILLSQKSGISVDELEGRADILEDIGAIHHIFSVASSLDSLVVGETQIVGQLKDAYSKSLELRWCGQMLSRLMQASFRCSAEVRRSTEITKNPVSISSVAVSCAKDRVGELKDAYAVVVGAGEMSRLAIKHLLASGVFVILLNRSIERARELALEIGGAIMVKPFSELKSVINSYPLLFSATSAPNAVITQDMIEDVEFERCWFDLALPRDVEMPSQKNIKLFQIDDLHATVEQNKTMREEQARIGYGVIGRHSEEFYLRFSDHPINPLIKGIRERAKECSIEKLDEAIKKGYIQKEQEESVKKLLHSVFNTFLHTPTIKLKSVAKDRSGECMIEALSQLFELNEKRDGSVA